MRLDLKKLLRSVFAIRRGERVLVMVDVPHGRMPDDPDWSDRRAMAEEWRTALESMGARVAPLLTYHATGASNSDLPNYGTMGRKRVVIQRVLSETDLALAMTRYSATAPLFAFTRRFPHLRAASMPNVLRRMTRSALAADYKVVATKCAALKRALDESSSAEVEFDTGHRFVFDLRHRTARADDGQCHPGGGHPVINLPSGEAFIVPYEGERRGDPSKTEGEIPVQWDDQLAVLRVRKNKITSILGRNAHAEKLRAHFAIDPARRNIAELGLGCNDRAIVTGNVLEDEKAGFHWAYGRSEHLGGVVGPDAFKRPEHVVHHDIVYAKGCPIGIRSLRLIRPDGRARVVMRNSAYTIFGKEGS